MKMEIMIDYLANVYPFESLIDYSWDLFLRDQIEEEEYFGRLKWWGVGVE